MLLVDVYLLLVGNLWSPDFWDIAAIISPYEYVSRLQRPAEFVSPNIFCKPSRMAGFWLLRKVVPQSMDDCSRADVLMRTAHVQVSCRSL